MTKRATKTGRELERRVAQAYRGMGARRVKHNVELAGHQIDVYVEFETADGGRHRIAVEVKDYARPLGINKVTTFLNNVTRLRNERLIDEAVIVAAAGFTPRLRDGAEKQGIRLLEPADLDAMVAGRPTLPQSSATPLPDGTRADWCLEHPYPMQPNFTGRDAEKNMLSEWLQGEQPLLVLRALGGFGKSALAWHWLTHEVTPERWPRVVWWGFYDEREFDAFLRRVLEYLGVDPRELGPRQQADALLREMQRPSTLLILDGFERALRAYGTMDAAYQGDDVARDKEPAQRDCVSPIAEHFLRSLCTLPDVQGKVLMTTRLLPRVLEHHGDLLLGCRYEELKQMEPADAVVFLDLQGVRGARAEIERVCGQYGLHPLALRLLAGLIMSDLQTPGDILAAERLDVTGDLKARRHHVLEHAYNNLTPERQELLSRIACFRGAVSHAALRGITQQMPPQRRSVVQRVVGLLRRPREALSHEALDLDTGLRDLVARGLLHHDRQAGHYDLHPIVRRYAYERLTGEQRQEAHSELRDYFAAVPEPERVQRLEDLRPVIELYHHTVRAGQHDEACRLFHDRIHTPTYYQLGAYDLYIELLSALFPGGEPFSASGQARLPQLKDEDAQGWTLNGLANGYSLSGQPGRAVPLLEQGLSIVEKLSDKRNLAVGLGNLAMDEIRVGALRDAEANLRRRIDLGREIEDGFKEAVGHQELGRLLAYGGRWVELQEELAAALATFEQQENVQAQSVTWAYRALRALLLARASALDGEGSHEPAHVHIDAALAAARRALELADETAEHPGFVYPIRDYVRAHWLLGAAQRENGELHAADRHLTDALRRCRSINVVDHEADVLLDLARLRAVQGQREAALELAGEALLITERSGYVLQAADVHLFLAKVALEDDDEAKALEHAQRAHRLATCDGPPDYTYKVAYDEAGALLAQMGQPAD